MSFMNGSNQKNSYQKGRWVNIDLHIHSIYSDGGFSPYQILKYASLHFLDAVVIADHSDVRGGLEGEKISGSSPDLPLTLPAQEVSAGNRFHFLMINSRTSCSDLTKENLFPSFEEHRRGGGIIILAHPWTIPKTKSVKNCLQELISANLVDGFELFNSAALELSNIHQTWQGLWEEWVAPYKLAVVGGSDFHHLHKGRFIGSGRTYLKVFAPGEQGILDALRARRSVAGLFGCRYHQKEESSENGLLWGQEPWAGELQKLREVLQRKLMGTVRINQTYRKLLLAMLEAGQYQYLQDLL